MTRRPARARTNGLARRLQEAMLLGFLLAALLPAVPAHAAPADALARLAAGVARATEPVVLPDGTRVTERVVFEDARPIVRIDTMDTKIDRGVEILEELRGSGRYEFVEEDQVVAPQSVPSDSNFVDATAWALRNTGAGGGVAGVDIGAEQAWSLFNGTAPVEVAILDTGVRGSHQDLEGSVMFNFSGGVEISETIDGNGHGTLLAGIVAAAPNGGGPHVGVGRNVRIRNYVVVDSMGRGYVSSVISAFNHVLYNTSARVVLCGWNSLGNSQALNDLIDSLANRVLVVAPAGNEGVSLAANVRSPATHPATGVMAVGAIDRTGALWSLSNYDPYNVDILAPGVEIVTTSNAGDDTYETASGTSLAAAHLAGAAALLFAQNPSLGAFEVRRLLMENATRSPSYAGLCSSGGRLNIGAAMQALVTRDTPVTVMPIATPATPYGHGSDVQIHALLLRGGLRTGGTVTAQVAGGPRVTLPGRVDLAGRYDGILRMPSSGTSATITLTGNDGVQTGTHSFTVQLVPRPPNDESGNALRIPAAGGVLFSTLDGATESVDKRDFDRWRDVWFKWTPTVTGPVRLTTYGGNVPVLFRVLDSAFVPSVPSSVKAIDKIHDWFEWNATAGATYYIYARPVQGVRGPFRIEAHTGPLLLPPDFAPQNAQRYEGPSFDVDGNSIYTGIPSADGSGAITGTINWFWRAPDTQMATASVDSTDSDHSIDVWQLPPEAFAGASNQQTSVLVANRPLQNVPLTGDERNHTKLRFPALRGQWYFIMLRPVDGDTGPFRVHLRTEPPGPRPTNDSSLTPKRIHGFEPIATSSLKFSTFEPGEPTTGAASGGSVWYVWNAPEDGELTLPVGSIDAFTRAPSGDLQRLTPPVRVRGGEDYLLRASGNYDALPNTTAMVSHQYVFNAAPTFGRNNTPENAYDLGNSSVSTRMPLAVRAPPAGTPPVSSRHPFGAWSTWLPPSDGIIRVDIPQTLSPATSTGFYTRTEQGAYERLLPQQDGGQNYLAVESGRRIWIATGVLLDTKSRDGVYLDFHPTISPANDAFGTPEVFAPATPGGAASRSLKLVAQRLTREPGEPPTADLPDSVTAWWSFVGNGGAFTVSGGLSSAPAVVELFEGSTLTALRRIFAKPAATLADFWVTTPGTEYRLRVSLPSRSVLPVDLTLGLRTPSSPLEPALRLPDAILFGTSGGSLTVQAVTANLPPTTSYSWSITRGGTLETLVDGDGAAGTTTRDLTLRRLDDSFHNATLMVSDGGLRASCRILLEDVLPVAFATPPTPSSQRIASVEASYSGTLALPHYWETRRVGGEWLPMALSPASSASWVELGASTWEPDLQLRCSVALGPRRQVMSSISASELRRPDPTCVIVEANETYNIGDLLKRTVRLANVESAILQERLPEDELWGARRVPYPDFSRVYSPTPLAPGEALWAPSTMSLTADYDGIRYRIACTTPQGEVRYFDLGSLFLIKRDLVFDGALRPIVYGSEPERAFVNWPANTKRIIFPQPPSPAGFPAGRHELRVSFEPLDPRADSYLPADIVLEVLKRPITVQPYPVSIPADLQPPALRALYTGFARGHGPWMLQTVPHAVTTVPVPAIPGTYTSRFTGGEDPNHDFTYLEGSYRVLPATSENLAFHLPLDGTVVDTSPATLQIPGATAAWTSDPFGAANKALALKGSSITIPELAGLIDRATEISFWLRIPATTPTSGQVTVFSFGDGRTPWISVRPGPYLILRYSPEGPEQTELQISPGWQRVTLRYTWNSATSANLFYALGATSNGYQVSGIRLARASMPGRITLGPLPTDTAPSDGFAVDDLRCYTASLDDETGRYLLEPNRDVIPVAGESFQRSYPTNLIAFRGNGEQWLSYYTRGLSSPWIHHSEHGWLYAVTDERWRQWFYEPQVIEGAPVGWLFTNPVLYPHLYSYRYGGWLYYRPGGTPKQRWFYLHQPGGGGRWISFPVK